MKYFLTFLAGVLSTLCLIIILNNCNINQQNYNDMKKYPVQLIEIKPSHITLNERKLIESYIFKRDQILSFIKYENYKITDEQANEIFDGILEASRVFDINPILILGLIHTESDFDPNAKSKSGAIGLMQINPKVWVWSNIEFPNLREKGYVEASADLYDIKTNIKCGTYILYNYINVGKRLKKKNPFEYALTRYFGGKRNRHYSRVMNSYYKFIKFSMRG